MATDGDPQPTNVILSADQFAAVQRVTLRPIPMQPEDPELWFDLLEQQFALHNITSERTRFIHASTLLEGRFAQEVKDIIRNPPADTPYTTLRRELISRLSISEAQRIRQLLGQEDLNGRSPSQFLRHLRSLAGSLSIPDPILRNLWLQRLPPQTQAILQGHKNQPLDELASIADGIMDVFPQIPVPAVHACSSTPRTTSTTSQLADIDELQRKLEALMTYCKDICQSRPRHRSPSRDPSPHRGYRDDTPRRRYRDDDTPRGYYPAPDYYQPREYSRGASPSRNRYRDQPSERPRNHHRSPPRPRRRLLEPKDGTCFYHTNFGDDARNCAQPCNYQLNSTGSR